ncbi:U32 family peptidase [Actinoallomurus sp. NBC_01490]|uniref:U32 family peptidase n=1 Tax=Actinoallomurus sp. NBC_01490 TaxID=2903557 RepID=UPI002E3015BB|nr:U32 family peptidase [Actinoallomurus sp. NBC_01490]
MTERSEGTGSIVRPVTSPPQEGAATGRSGEAGNTVRTVASPAREGDPMGATRRYLAAMGLPDSDLGAPPESDRRFPDGGQYRVEIPSVEGPPAFRAVIAAAREHGVRVHRISQGSGIMLQTDAEIREMVALGAEHDIEVCLFVGPRASWDVGVQVTASSGAVASGSLRGADQLVYGIEDVVRAVGLGLRSVLVADVGQLWVLGRMKRTGDLPPDLILKSSVSLPAANPATARLLEDLGVTTVNLPIDLTLAQVAAIRAAVDVPLDLYVEGADDFGGTVRYYEVPELVRVAAPVHLKFTVRNAPGIYPSGRHLEPVAVATAQERVRRAAIGVAMLRRYRPGAVESTSSRLLPAGP